MKKISLIDVSSQAGIGLRTQHISEVLEQEIQVPWFELLLDNWLAEGGLTSYYLDAVIERYPVTLHGIGLSLGGVEALDTDYLTKVKALMHRTKALCYSEHLCFSQLQSYYAPDLLPLPYTEECLRHVAQRIDQVQDFLGCQILVENVSTYLQYRESTLSEGEFIASLADEADCGLILDVNNFYVNQKNHNQDALTEIKHLSYQRVKEIHLAGFADQGDYLIDAHNNPVSIDVWDLYESVLQLCGSTATLIEWDNDIPELFVLLDERNKAQTYLDERMKREAS